MNEIRLGLPIKRGEDIFIRDEEGNITGAKHTTVTRLVEDPQYVAARQAEHDARIDDERRTGYQKKRAEEYPGFGELADIIYWAMDDQINIADVPLSEKEQKWYDKCKAVKQKHPKPELQ